MVGERYDLRANSPRATSSPHVDEDVSLSYSVAAIFRPRLLLSDGWRWQTSLAKLSVDLA